MYADVGGFGMESSLGVAMSGKRKKGPAESGQGVGGEAGFARARDAPSVDVLQELVSNLDMCRDVLLNHGKSVQEVYYYNSSADVRSCPLLSTL